MVSVEKIINQSDRLRLLKATRELINVIGMIPLVVQIGDLKVSTWLELLKPWRKPLTGYKI